MLNSKIFLYAYWRSTAAYRVRIALNLKNIAYDVKIVNLIANGGEQKNSEYAQINPQKLVPALVTDGQVLTQSLAILEYLEEVYPHPSILPGDPIHKAKVRSVAQAIACDIHPINNLRVLQYLGGEMGVEKPSRDQWYRHWITEGFSAIEKILSDSPEAGKFCFGNEPTMADIALVAQMYNARRFNVDLSAFPTLVRIDAACNKSKAFIDAAPENQPDSTSVRVPITDE